MLEMLELKAAVSDALRPKSDKSGGHRTPSTVATLFAELGFKIDNQGIDTFRTTIKDIQKELGNVMRTSANTGKSVSALIKKINGVNSAFDPTKMQAWRKQLNTGVKSYIDMIEEKEKALKS